jgi:hypothetical protein
MKNTITNNIHLYGTFMENGRFLVSIFNMTKNPIKIENFYDTVDMFIRKYGGCRVGLNNFLFSDKYSRVIKRRSINYKNKYNAKIS